MSASKIWSAVWGAAAVVVSIQGCAAPPPAASGSELDLGDDTANSKAAPDAPEGTQSSVELGSGTAGTEPAAEPEREDGDGKASTAPATCTKDAECNQAGRICTAGACVKGCREDAQCPTNQVCLQGQCDFDDSSVECYYDFDCELGAICVSSACIAGCHGNIDCPTGQTCTSGSCKATTTTTPPAGGTPCVSDGQCNPGVNGAGKICSAQGTCVDGCHQDNQCPGSKICVSGMCR